MSWKGRRKIISAHRIHDLICKKILQTTHTHTIVRTNKLIQQSCRIQIHTQNLVVGTSLVAQWLRICLPVQGTRVRSLVQEDPKCRRATKSVRHNYWAYALESTSHNYWSPRATTTEARKPRARAPQEKPPQWETCAPQQRVAPDHHN